MKNIVLLGGSSFARLKGISKGLAQNKINLYNLSLGATTSIQSLYEILRLKNQEILQNSNLIIVNSNANEIVCNLNPYDSLSLSSILDSLRMFYKKLFDLKRKVLVLILPYKHGNYKIINNFHLHFCFKYGFNYIDMHEFYEKKDLFEFGDRYDGVHQFDFIMRKLGKNIANNLHLFHESKKINDDNLNIKFKICTPKDMISLKPLESLEIRNTLYQEQVYKIDENAILSFPKDCYGYEILAIHTWNKQITKSMQVLDWKNNYSNILIQNKNTKILKAANFANSVFEIKNQFIIDENSTITCGYKLHDFTEYYAYTENYNANSIEHNTLSLIAFLLYKTKSKKGDLNEFEINYEKNEKYNFNFLIPPIDEYKEIIDEYLKSIKIQISL